ncbi:MAG: aldolase/citrate lyase family protein [Nitrospinota bacterium]
MFGLEQKLFDQLVRLKEKFDLQGIKAEFEAEGSSFRDLVRLRRITDKLDIPLHLKIGGVEALRDIKDSLEIGVDGLIAPMVESCFGLKKFIDGVDSIYQGTDVHLSINIETQQAVSNLKEILKLGKGKIDNITVGRTDLSASYFDPKIIPDSDFIFGLLEEIGNDVSSSEMKMTVGGSVSKKSIERFGRDTEKWPRLIHRLETRKVILPTKVMLEDKNSIAEALRFEELYILSKKEISDLFMKSETARLTRLKMRS